MPNRDLQDHRREYESKGLNKEDIHLDPHEQFSSWLNEALSHDDIIDPTAMSVASVDANGQPHCRIVLLKSFDNDGFVFYTNYSSPKGQDLSQNPKAALLFHWPQMDRQIRIEGTVKRTTLTESELYFDSRPKESQLAAYISHQSEPVSGRRMLEMNMELAREEHSNKPVFRPNDWGGFRLEATSFEFWQGRPSRLHDRFKYTLKETETSSKNHQAWLINRLSP